MNPNHNHTAPEEIYQKMLHVGSQCASCGTNLSEIKEKLLQSNLISENEDQTILKILFNNTFTHDNTNKYYGSYCNAPEPEFECNPINKEEYDRLEKVHNEYDHEHNCKWFLTPEALMNLLRLKESVKSSKQLELLQNQLQTLNSQIQLTEQNSTDAKEDSKFARNLAWASIILSIVLGLPDWITLKDTTNDQIKNNTTLILPLEQQQIKELQEANQSLDSLLFLYRNHIYDDKIHLKYTSPKNDKTLNNNLKRDKNK